MKLSSLLLRFALLALPAAGQDCVQNVRLPDTLGSGAGAAFANLSRGCSHWLFAYSADTIAGVEIQVETAPDVAGAPGAWTVAPASGVLIGAFPVVSDEGGSVVFDVWAPWVRVNLIAGAGDPLTVKAILYGWRTGPPITRTVGGVLNPAGGFNPWLFAVIGTAGQAFPATIDESRYRVDEGTFFSASARTSMIAAQTVYHQFVTPAAPVSVHFYYEVSCTAQTSVAFSEMPTTSAAGTVVPNYNRNRPSSTVAASVLTIAPTVSNEGTQLSFSTCGSGAVGGVVGGVDTTRYEWILKAGTKYLLRLVAGAAASDNTARFGWYEVP